MSARPLGEAEVVEVRSESDVTALAGSVLSPDRDGPLLCLTTRARERHSALDAVDVRAVVGDGVPVYVVPNGPLTRRLAELLPPKLEVYGGAARIWWPGVDEGSDPRDHPLVQDRYCVFGSKANVELRRAWERGASSSPRGGEGPRIAFAEAERDGAHENLQRVATELAEVRQELRRAHERAASAEQVAREQRRSARSREPLVTDEPALARDPEADFHVALVMEWAAVLPVPERRQDPLKTYILGPEFLDSLDALPEVPIERAARVCALVACGLVRGLDGLELHQLRTGVGGGDPQRSRSDGAKAWRCALKRGTPSAPRLHFWRRTHGVIEFANVVRHDDFSIL